MSRGLLLFMAVVTHIALVVLVAGIVFFATGDAPIVEPDASFLLGPAMVLASSACVFLVLARRFGVVERDGRDPGRRNWPPALASTLAAYLAVLGVGAGLYSLGRSDAVWLLLFAGRYAAAPFVVSQAIAAGAVTFGALLIERVQPVPTR